MAIGDVQGEHCQTVYGAEMALKMNRMARVNSMGFVWVAFDVDPVVSETVVIGIVSEVATGIVLEVTGIALVVGMAVCVGVKAAVSLHWGQRGFYPVGKLRVF